MPLNRRQFLLLGGAFGGVGLSVVAQRWAAGQSALTEARSSIDLNEYSSPASQNPVAAPSPSAVPEITDPLNPPRGDVRIVVISDLNSQYGSTDYEVEVDNAIARIPSWQPDLVLCGGDMVAGQQPSLTRSEIEAMWAAFDQHVSAPLRTAKIPYGFTLGNHDASSAQAINGGLLFGAERDLANDYWNQPQHDPGLNFVDRAKFPFYYTFQQKDIFFLIWDASSAQIPADQLAWAEQSLSSPAAKAAKLRIVVGHLPLYGITVGRADPGEYLENAEGLRSLLERHQVHTYVSGHDHAYYPGHKGQLELLHCGILGSGVRPLLNGDLPPRKTLTIVDIDSASAHTRYTTFDASTMERVNQQELPKLIASPGGKVLRRDLAWEDLTPAEQAVDYVPRG
ncbi:MAG: metallophosphoesterase [Drouetiella hepatica Uher 2000/2452]|jgi:Icc-related predicted phosphoesterase|uniref:Metallophosphoesterase n=1 Tax=Drouetiella hepatica Uher 2000/2452 TaxID=904376 RepID=A0A951QA82_9CYAN|nr:metallophosphoesterase [Drouetiella hepatica Uher 2000/2452]